MRALSVLTLLFTAGSLLLHFFVILGGAKHHGILRDFFWLRVNTSKYQKSEPISDWTMYGLCSWQGSDVKKPGKQGECTKNKADYPFDPSKQLGSGVPQEFSKHRTFYYYLSRFQYPFYLIAMFFEFLVLCIGLFAICSRLIGYLSSLLTLLAFVFAATAAALSTVWVVRGSKQFKKAGSDTYLGRKNLAFVWTVVFMLAVNTFVFCCVGPSKKKNKHTTDNEYADAPDHPINEDNNENFGSSGGVYKFGFGSRKTNEVAPEAERDADASSFVRAV